MNAGSHRQDMAADHDFLAEISLSPKENSDDCNVSDLSSTYWSARISVKLHYSNTHDKYKGLIPRLDLTNLPPDSDDESDTKNKNDNDYTNSESSLLEE